MNLPAAKPCPIHDLRTLVRELGRLAGRMKGRMNGDAITEILDRSHISDDEVAPFVAPSAASYSRRRVARTEAFEVLVMTWLPGQVTAAHDHAGAVSAFKILRGTAQETRFTQAADNLVDPTNIRELHEGECGLDEGDVVHAIRNACPRKELLVTIHVYAPPLPELRRFTIRSEGRPLAGAFQRQRASSAPVVAIIGAGFSGAMVAAHLARKSAKSRRPIHIVIIDRQPSIAEGAAYRTADASHLLNVPASGMSAWPDLPDDFLEWARGRDPALGRYTFLQRQAYGAYLRDTFFNAVAQSDTRTSIEIRREEAGRIERRDMGGWRVHCGASHTIDAEAVVLATGHRLPEDPLKQRWSGSRARYISDPWASMALPSIEPNESVCLLGTGLTAIDVLLSVSRQPRTAPVVALSRRGLLPAAHAPALLAPIDPKAWVEQLLRGGTGITTSALTRGIRRAVHEAESAGLDWRQVVDGLRPYTSRIWQALPPSQKSRFLRHARPFWEVMRHRIAPSVAECVRELTSAGIFSAGAARMVSACGAVDGVTLTVRRPRGPIPEALRFDWIVNCAGPGTGRGVGRPSVIEGLIKAGHLEDDPLGLGVRSTPEGRAVADGRIIEDLIVIGTLRKPDLWESVAVPELRVQAQVAADAIAQRIHDV